MIGKGFRQRSVLAATLGGVILIRGIGFGAQTRRGANVLQGHRANSSEQVSGVSSAELDRADVPDHLRRKPAVGALDQDARRDAADAALAHRPERRRPEVQERHVALAESRSTRSSRGSTPARRRAIRRTCRPPRPIAADNSWKGVRDGFGEPDLVIRSSEYKMPAHGPGRLVPADERDSDHRAALGEDGRDSSDQPEGAQGGAPLDRLPGAERRERRVGQHRHRQRPGRPRPRRKTS